MNHSDITAAITAIRYTSDLGRHAVAITRTADTGPDSRHPPRGVHLLPIGTATPTLLREAYQAIRTEVDSTIGWDSMPAELLARPDCCRRGIAPGGPRHPAHPHLNTTGEPT